MMLRQMAKMALIMALNSESDDIRLSAARTILESDSDIDMSEEEVTEFAVSMAKVSSAMATARTATHAAFYGEPAKPIDLAAHRQERNPA